MKSFIVLISIFALSTLRLEAQHVSTTLPLVKGIAGDTTLQVNQSFVIYGREFTPVDSVSVMWDHQNHLFSVYGDAYADLAGSNVHFRFGVPDTSQFQIKTDSTLQLYTPWLIDTFNLEGQAFLGTYPETHFAHYTTGEFIWGNLKSIIGGVAYASRMGSSETPGCEISSNQAQSIWVHVQDAVELLGLPTADPSMTDIIIKHDSGDPAGKFFGHGTWVITLLDEVQVVQLGSTTKPGLILQDGAVDSVSFFTAGGGFLFGLLPVVDGMLVNYNHYKNQYSISGKIIVGVPLGGVVKALGAKYAPSFQIDAGDGNTAGFLLNPSNGHFTVEDALFQLRNVGTAQKPSLGGFTINSLAMHVSNNLPDSFAVNVTLPPGFSLQGSFGFSIFPSKPPDERFKINSIEFDWEAQTLANAIPLGTTGFTIVKILGGVENLENPMDLTLVADMGLVYGALETISLSPFGLPGSAQIATVYIEGNAQLSLHGLSVTVDGDLGAYFTNGSWNGLIAQLGTNLDIQWGRSYSVSATIKAYVPPSDFLDGTIEATLSESGDIDAYGSVSIQVPSIIPIIGGKHLTGIKGALRHRNLHMDQSYAAGWTKINLGFDHVVIGAKANFKTKKITKVGAAQEKSITQQLTSDLNQHPVQNGQEQNNWYQCGVNHTFNLESTKPAAYLQNQLIIINTRFQDPTPPNNYYSPALAVFTSPSGSTDLKLLTPADTFNTYYNLGQTTPQNNTLSIDFYQNYLGPPDTIRWITINNAAESYQNIDWIHQPDLLLTPGQYMMNLSGYCPTNGEYLMESDVKFSASPVFPKPTISFELNASNDFVTTYSAYLTDSTRVSLYWSYDKSYGGSLVSHASYYEGTLVADSTYQWVYSNWNPGIVSGDRIYFYTVIDDFVNEPVYSSFDSLFYEEQIAVSITGVTDSTMVVLTPADTTQPLVPGRLNSDGLFVFYNVPLGGYRVDCYSNHDSSSFDVNVNVSDLDGEVNDITYHSPQWISTEFTPETWDNGLVWVFGTLFAQNIPLFGTVKDTSGQIAVGAHIFVLNAQDSVLQSYVEYGNGYIITDVPSGYHRVAVALPDANTFHWPTTQDLEYINTVGYGILLIQDSVHFTQQSRALNFNPLPGAQGVIFIAIDFDGNPVENVVVSIQLADGTGPVYQAVSDANGNTFFEGEEFLTFTPYKFKTSWPSGYVAITQNQTFEWSGNTDPQLVIGMQE